MIFAIIKKNKGICLEGTEYLVLQLLALVYRFLELLVLPQPLKYLRPGLINCDRAPRIMDVGTGPVDSSEGQSVVDDTRSTLHHGIQIAE